MKTAWIMIVIFAITLGGCYNDKVVNLDINKNGCDTINISFEQNIRPILDQQCASCHAAGVYQTLGGNYNLDGYSNVSSFANPNGLLIKTITGDPSVPQMPLLPPPSFLPARSCKYKNG